ncbi:MAG: NUDIX domain-containing protein [Candidatus Omnitrophota bacterium]
MKSSIIKKITACFALSAFLLTSAVAPVSHVYGQEFLRLLPPGERIGLTAAFTPPLLKGVRIYPDNPFRLDFILDKGGANKPLPTWGHSAPLQDHQRGSVSPSTLPNEQGFDMKAAQVVNRMPYQKDAQRLIKYFLASITVPEKDLWVNLSPYEKDRIVPDAFGVTEMGRDLLAQDYLLKQLTASLLYPENGLGKEFWAKVYEQAQAKFGTTDIPVDTFNKVWIMPDKAEVFEHGNAVYVTQAKLKVMLDTDYVAMNHDAVGARHGVPEMASHRPILGEETSPVHSMNDSGEISKNILRQIIIPALEKEVNEGQSFTQLRQVYHSLILALWFKDKIVGAIHESPLRNFYVDQDKVAGVDIADKAAKDKIWAKYVEAFKKGAYNYIKEDLDPNTQQTVTRKYFSGGAALYQTRKVLKITNDRAPLPQGISDRAMIIESKLNVVDQMILEQGEGAGQNDQSMKVVQDIVYSDAVVDSQSKAKKARTVFVNIGRDTKLKFNGLERKIARPFTEEELKRLPPIGTSSGELMKVKSEEIQMIRQGLYDRSTSKFEIPIIITDKEGQDHYDRVLGFGTTETAKLRDLGKTFDQMKVPGALLQISAGNQGDQPGNFTLLSKGDLWEMRGAADQGLNRPFRVLVQYADGHRSLMRVEIKWDGGRFKVYENAGHELDPKLIDFVLSATPLFWQGEPAHQLLKESYIRSADLRHLFRFPNGFVFYGDVAGDEKKYLSAFKNMPIEIDVKNEPDVALLEGVGYSKVGRREDVLVPGQYWYSSVSKQLVIVLLPSKYPVNVLAVGPNNELGSVVIDGLSGRVGADYWTAGEWISKQVEKMFGWKPQAVLALDNGLDPSVVQFGRYGEKMPLVEGRDKVNASLNVLSLTPPVTDLTGIDQLIRAKGLEKYQSAYNEPQGDEFHIERPTLKHHLQAMLKGLEAVEDVGDIIPGYRPKDILRAEDINFIHENRDFYEWHILLHDLGKAETRKPGIDGKIGYPGHSEKSLDLVQNEVFMQAYPQAESLRKIIKLHMIPFVYSSKDAESLGVKDPYFDNEIQSYIHAKEMGLLFEYFEAFRRHHDLALDDFKRLIFAAFLDMYLPTADNRGFAKDMDKIKDAIVYLQEIEVIEQGRERLLKMINAHPKEAAYLKVLSERLPLIHPRKRRHVVNVVETYYRLLEGVYEPLYDALALSPEEKEKMTLPMYSTFLDGVKKDFSYTNDVNLKMMSILPMVHDLGSMKGQRDWIHNQTGETRIPDLLRQKTDLTEKEIQYLQRMVYLHGAIQNVGSDFFPKEISKLDAELKNMLFIFSIIDMIGRDDGRNIATIELINGFRKKFELVNTALLEDRTFVDHRIGMAFSPFPVKQEIQDQRRQRVLGFIQGRDGQWQSDFYENLSQARVYVFDIFTRFSNLPGDAYPLLLARISDEIADAKKLNPDITEVILDTDVDFMGLPFAGPEGVIRNMYVAAMYKQLMSKGDLFKTFVDPQTGVLHLTIKLNQILQDVKTNQGRVNKTIKYMLSKNEHLISDLVSFGNKLDLSSDQFFELIGALSEAKAFKLDYTKPAWTSYLPTYLADGTPTGKVIGYHVPKRENTWKKASVVFLFSSTGKLLLQVRKAEKTVDLSVGGDVEIGQSGAQAAVREAEEELHLPLKIDDLKPVVDPSGVFRFNFEVVADKADFNRVVLEKEGFDQQGTYVIPWPDKPATEIFDVFYARLTPEVEQRWRKGVGDIFMSWEEFKAGGERKFNSEVSGIVEVDPKELLEYYSLPKDQRRQLLFRGLVGTLAYKSVRQLLGEEVSISENAGVVLDSHRHTFYQKLALQGWSFAYDEKSLAKMSLRPITRELDHSLRSLVFAPSESDVELRKNLQRFSDRLRETKAFRNGKVLLNIDQGPFGLHQTVLNSKMVAGLGNNAVSLIAQGLSHLNLPCIFYGVFINPFNGRVSVAGYDKANIMIDFRTKITGQEQNSPMVHFAIANVLAPLTALERSEWIHAVKEFETFNFGNVSVDRLFLVEHVNDVLRNAKVIQAYDFAQKIDSSDKGGIDLTRNKINMKIQGLGDGAQFKFDPAMIEQLQHASGLTPVILDIHPMATSVSMFLGLASKS